MRIDERRSSFYLNETLTNHLARYIDTKKKEIDENYDSELSSYVRNSQIIYETQLLIKKNAEEYYSGRVGRRPIYDLSCFLVMASSMFVPEHLRDEDAARDASAVGAGDQVPNAPLWALVYAACFFAQIYWGSSVFPQSSQTSSGTSTSACQDLSLIHI